MGSPVASRWAGCLQNDPSSRSRTCGYTYCLGLLQLIISYSSEYADFVGSDVWTMTSAQIYTCTYMCIYMHIYLFTSICTYSLTYIHADIHSYIHVHVYIAVVG